MEDDKNAVQADVVEPRADKIDVVVEKEKESTPAPERTLEASRKRCRAVARQLRAHAGPVLDEMELANLEQVRNEIQEELEAAGMIPVGSLMIVYLDQEPGRCADCFDSAADALGTCIDNLGACREAAARRLSSLAEKVNRGKVSAKYASKMGGHVMDEVESKDFRGIFDKARPFDNKNVLNMLGTRGLERLGLDRNARLSDLTVNDVKSLLVALADGIGE